MSIRHWAGVVPEIQMFFLLFVFTNILSFPFTVTYTPYNFSPNLYHIQFKYVHTKQYQIFHYFKELLIQKINLKNNSDQSCVFCNRFYPNFCLSLHVYTFPQNYL